jgi:hypothetical protein
MFCNALTQINVRREVLQHDSADRPYAGKYRLLTRAFDLSRMICHA